MTVLSRIRNVPSWQVTLGAALLGLGFLIAAQLASERPRVRYTTQERTPLLETATGLQAQQDQLKSRLLELRTQIGQIEGAGQGSAELVRELNDDLEQARIAAGLIPLTGTGIVLQLEDSLQPVSGEASQDDYLVGARDLRVVIEELWLAGAEAIAVNGERITPTSSAIDIGTSVLVNAAYLAPPYQVTALGPDDLYDRLSSAPGLHRLRPRSGGGVRDPPLVRGATQRRGAGVRGHGLAALLAAAHLAISGARRDPRLEPAGLIAMRIRRNQLTIAAVAFLLGVLVVVQLRAQAGGAGLAALSAQDLTVFVASVNERNDELRQEIASLERELGTLTSNQDRGEASIDEIRTDLRRVRAYAGPGPGRRPRGDDHGQWPDRRAGPGGSHQRTAQCRSRGDRLERDPAGPGCRCRRGTRLGKPRRRTAR